MGAHALPLDANADLSPTGLAELLVDVLDALDLDTAHVVGVDTGGALTQILMANHRSRVGRVVLTACDAYEEFPPTTLIGRVFRPVFWPGLTAVAATALRLRAVRRLVTLRPITHAGVGDDVVQWWVAPLRNREVRRDVRKAFRQMSPRHTVAAADQTATSPGQC